MRDKVTVCTLYDILMQQKEKTLQYVQAVGLLLEQDWKLVAFTAKV